MSSKYETGHTKNVANLKTLNNFLASLGAKYNPAQKSIQLPELQAKQAEAEQALVTLQDNFTAYTAAVDDQQAAFGQLSKLVTRVVKAYKSSISNPAEAETVISLQGKIRGDKKAKADIKKETTPEGKDSISTSQRSYDNRLANFQQLILVVAANKAYQPNETDLQAASLQALARELKQKTEAVDMVAAPLINNRIARNELMYSSRSGLFTTTLKAIKDYIISVFGAGSAQSKYINTLDFRGIKA